jgi:hypothetical protein
VSRAVLDSYPSSLEFAMPAHLDCVPQDKNCTLSSVECSSHNDLADLLRQEGIVSSFAGSVL